MKKGLRPPGKAIASPRHGLKHCPDEEGIKTVLFHGYLLISLGLKHCPDEEGIKTSIGFRYPRLLIEFETLP